MYKGHQPLPDQAQVIVDMVRHLENWSTPERIAEGQAAALAVFQRQQERAKAEIEQTKEKYRQGIALIGKKNFAKLVKDMALIASRDFLVYKTDKIAESAVQKYKRSRQFKEDVRRYKNVQKQMDAKNKIISKIGKFATKMKGVLKKLPPKAAEVCVEKHGLQAMKRKLEESQQAERRPLWLSL